MRERLTVSVLTLSSRGGRQAADPEWATRIRLEKFRWHNSQWLDMVESQPADEAAVYDADGETFLHERDVLYQSGEDGGPARTGSGEDRGPGGRIWSVKVSYGREE